VLTPTRYSNSSRADALQATAWSELPLSLADTFCRLFMAGQPRQHDQYFVSSNVETG
jgi:hypothetical protein